MDTELPQTEISVIVPVFNCGDCLRALYEQIVHVLDDMRKSSRIVFVEDRGADNAWEVIVQLAALDSRVAGYRLRRNYGQHAAIAVGLSRASSKWYVVMDCDLQDPPALIPRMYDAAQRGAEIVLARYISRGHPVWRNRMSGLYFVAMRLLGGHPLLGRCGPFSMISSAARDAYLSRRETHLGYNVLLLASGLKVDTIDYHKGARYSGKSAYTLRRLVRSGLNVSIFRRSAIRRTMYTLLFSLLVLGALSWRPEQRLSCALLGVALATGFVLALLECWWHRRLGLPRPEVAEAT